MRHVHGTNAFFIELCKIHLQKENGQISLSDFLKELTAAGLQVGTDKRLSEFDEHLKELGISDTDVPQKEISVDRAKFSE